MRAAGGTLVEVVVLVGGLVTTVGVGAVTSLSGAADCDPLSPRAEEHATNANAAAVPSAVTRNHPAVVERATTGEG